MLKFLSIIIYLILGLILLPHYQYLLNPDGIAYISIAQKYAAGDFQNAINGYWGPLFSWILVPFLWLKIDPLISVKIITLTAGLITLIASSHLFKFFTFALIPILLYQALIVINPDLLIVAIFFLLLAALYSKNWLLIGILGGLGYLTKSYFFYFFIIYIISYILLFRHKHLNLYTFIPFILISLCWIAILSFHYQKFTISTTGQFNHALIRDLEQKSYPMYYIGLIPPANSSAISVWENPPLFKLQDWNPVSYEQTKIIYINIKKTIKIYLGFSVFSLPIIAISVFYPRFYWLLLPLIIYNFGYILLTVESRYLWTFELILLVLGGFFIDQLTQKYLKYKFLLLAILILSFWRLPIKALIDNYDSGQKLYVFSKTLPHLENAKIASNTNWDQTNYLAYYFNARYFGQMKKDLTEEEIQSELQKHQIDYYFHWSHLAPSPDSIPKLTIQKLY